MKKSAKIILPALTISLLGSLAWAHSKVETQYPMPTTPTLLDASESRSVTLEVDGVSCASCSLAIRKALKKVDGVRGIDEGESKELLIVQVDASKITDEALVQAVKKAGFGAKVVAPKS